MSIVDEDKTQGVAAPMPYSIQWLDDGAVFVIDRPEKCNALTKPVLDGLAACLDAVEARGLRLLAIVGSGEKAFCAGTDVAELQAMPVEARVAKSAMARALLVRIARSRVISVAAINGLAFGGGLEIAMACTLRICLPRATFSLPEIKLGLLPAYAGTQLLPTLVGPARALEIMLTGRALSAEEALSIGLVHRIAPAGTSILGAALSFGREVSRHSPTAVDSIRQCVNAAGPMVSEPGLAVEGRQVQAVFDSSEAHEGVAAFLEKRPPRF